MGEPLPWWYEMFFNVNKHPLRVCIENLVLMTADDELPEVELLDRFAWKVDEYAKSKMLVNDSIARDALWQWKELMFFDPTKLVSGVKQNES
jgi:hypothetical protein